jgi:prepilin-type N-terminal cleavage/methylation domain-containing protein
MKKQGFTLIELMIAVTMMAILAMLAIPRIDNLIARARAAEATVVIRTYERIQSSYYFAMGEVGTLTELGLELPQNGYFSYTIDIQTSNAALTAAGGIKVAASEKASEAASKKSSSSTAGSSAAAASSTSTTPPASSAAPASSTSTPSSTATASSSSTKKDDTGNQVDLCHIPPGNEENSFIVKVGTPSYNSHMAHGDSPAPCDPSDKEEETNGYTTPLVLIIATVTRPIAYNCRVGDAVFSEWFPLGVTRGDLNMGSCTDYMGRSFLE